MVTFTRFEKTTEHAYNFTVKTPTVYKGEVLLADGQHGPEVNIRYSEPRNESVPDDVRAAVDPHVIEKIIKEVLA